MTDPQSGTLLLEQRMIHEQALNQNTAASIQSATLTLFYLPHRTYIFEVERHCVISGSLSLIVDSS